jgi:hypothetical protein
MNEVGKSLVFYLKYYPEMTQLFEKEEPEESLSGIEEVADQNFTKKVQAVGYAACDEAARLVDQCTLDLLKRLGLMSIVKIKPRKRSIISNWSLAIDVWPAGKKESDQVTRQLGLNLDRDGLIPWVWSRGGLAVEEKIVKCFAQGVQCYPSGSHSDWDSGSVRLRTIPVPWNKAHDDFTLNADDIIKQAQGVLANITPEFIKKFIAPW